KQPERAALLVDDPIVDVDRDKDLVAQILVVAIDSADLVDQSIVGVGDPQVHPKLALLREPRGDLVAGPGVLELDRQLEGPPARERIAQRKPEAAAEQEVASLITTKRDPGRVELRLIDVRLIELGRERDVDAGKIVGRDRAALPGPGRDPQFGPLAGRPRFEVSPGRAAAAQGGDVGLADPRRRWIAGDTDPGKAAHVAVLAVRRL